MSIKKDKCKCPHGKEIGKFCARCTYGNYGQMRSEEHIHDAVDDLKMPIGYKLANAYYTLYPYENE